VLRCVCTVRACQCTHAVRAQSRMPSQKERGELCVRCVWYGPDLTKQKTHPVRVCAVSHSSHVVLVDETEREQPRP
jgi:hypothetical protein